MNDFPLVSVIMSAYNSETTILKAIESVRNQTFRHYEIIVVDDGSVDSTVNLLNSLKDIKLIKQTNQGPSAARNRGVEEAQGDYITFLDSDDFWHPQKLEIQLRISRMFQNYGMIATSYKTISEIPTDFVFPVYKIPSKESIKEVSLYRFFETTFCLPSTVLIPKAIFLEMGGFDPELRASEDRDLWLKIAYKYPIYYIPIDLLLYFVRKEGLSRSIRIIGQINKIFIAEKWNPTKADTLDVLGKIDNKLYNKIFRKIVIQVGQWILKYRTIADFKNNTMNSYKIFNLYWRRFSYIFGFCSSLIKLKIITRNIIKYSFLKTQNQKIDEKLIAKLYEI